MGHNLALEGSELQREHRRVVLEVRHRERKVRREVRHMAPAGAVRAAEHHMTLLVVHQMVVADYVGARRMAVDQVGVRHMGPEELGDTGYEMALHMVVAAVVDNLAVVEDTPDFDAGIVLGEDIPAAGRILEGLQEEGRRSPVGLGGLVEGTGLAAAVDSLFQCQ